LENSTKIVNNQSNIENKDDVQIQAGRFGVNQAATQLTKQLTVNMFTSRD
jgi:hypothetical protein